MLEKIEIYDVTPRDGDQARNVNLSSEEKVAIARRLDESGFDYVEAGYPLSNESDRAVFQELRSHPLKHAKHVAFGMTRRRDGIAEKDEGLQALIASGAPAITIVGKSSRFQAQTVLGVDPALNLSMIQDSLQFLSKQSGDLTYDAEHFFDAWKENPDYALKTLETAAQAGAKRIVLCDTNGGSLPEQIHEVTQHVLQRLKGLTIGMHMHNDRGLATANTLAGVRAGARHIQGTLNGVGERAGNADILELIANLDLEGYETIGKMNIAQLTPLSQEAARICRVPRDPRQPFVGPNAFSHKGGMHASGMEKHPKAYEFTEAGRYGNTRNILTSKQAGLSTIRTFVTQAKLLSQETKNQILQNRSEQEMILKEMKQLEDNGYSFAEAEASVELLILRTLGLFQPLFQRVGSTRLYGVLGKHWQTNLKIDVPGKEMGIHVVDEGLGPVQSLSRALKKALLPHHPSLAKLQLSEFRVDMAPVSHEDVASIVQVSTEFTDDTDSWSTIGASRDLVEAAWIAINDGIEYKLLKDDLSPSVSHS